MTAEEQLMVFLQADRCPSGFCARSKWLEDENIKVYVRHAGHIDNTRNMPWWLDIANIEVTEGLRGRGFFTRFLDYAEWVNPWHGIFVENVLEPRLIRFFERRGYVKLVNSHALSPCFYKTRSDMKSVWIKDEDLVRELRIVGAQYTSPWGLVAPQDAHSETHVAHHYDLGDLLPAGVYRHGESRPGTFVVRVEFIPDENEP